MILYLIIIFLLYIVFNTNNIIEKLSSNKKTCCLIKKQYIKDNNHPYGGDFNYVINKMQDKYCNYDLYILNDIQQLYVNDDNKCNINNIGSCRNFNKECIDFVDKNFCDKYNMTWSNKTCQHPLEFEWKDPIKIILPSNIKTNNTSQQIKLFN
jgi:hypothetical protein